MSNETLNLDTLTRLPLTHKRKLDRVIARYILGWTFSMHPDAKEGVLVPPSKLYELAKKEDLPHFTTNDSDAMQGLVYLMNNNKSVRLSMKVAYIDSIKSIYYSVVLKDVAKDSLLLYNGTGRTLADATVEALIKYKNLGDWAQFLDKA